mgnify:CR=1 FL=1
MAISSETTPGQELQAEVLRTSESDRFWLSATRQDLPDLDRKIKEEAKRYGDMEPLVFQYCRGSGQGENEGDCADMLPMHGCLPLFEDTRRIRLTRTRRQTQ